MVPFLIWPAVSGLFYSFTNYAPGVNEAHWVGLRNYTTIIEDPTYQTAWRNMLVFAIITIPAELAIGFALAYLLREPFPGRGLFRIGLLIPWLVSPIANGVMWYFLLNLQWGIFNFILSWLGLTALPSPLGLSSLALVTTAAVSVWRNSPLAGFLFLPGLLAVPPADWEVANLEGASIFDRILHIALPRLRPLFWAVALLLTGDALGTFDTILILTGGGPGAATITPAFYSYQQAFQFFNWPIGATSAWLIVVSILLMGIAFLRLVSAEVN